MNFLVIGTDHGLQERDPGFEGMLRALVKIEFIQPLGAIGEEFGRKIADGDWNRVLPGELHATSHIINVRGAHHRERATIVGKVPHLPRLVIARRISTQHPPPNHAGKIVEVGNRIVGHEGGQNPHRTRGHKPGMYKFTTAPGTMIGFANVHGLLSGMLVTEVCQILAVRE